MVIDSMLKVSESTMPMTRTFGLARVAVAPSEPGSLDCRRADERDRRGVARVIRQGHPERAIARRDGIDATLDKTQEQRPG